MKKFLALILIFAFGMLSLGHADNSAFTPVPTPTAQNTPITQPNGPPMTLYGGEFFNNSIIGLNRNPATTGVVDIKCSAVMNINKGDFVAWVNETWTTQALYGGFRPVTESTTVANANWAGVAMDTVSYPAGVAIGTSTTPYTQIRVAISGDVRVSSAGTLTPLAGTLYIMGGTAGQLTPASSLSAAAVALYTPLSRTPICAYALENETLTGKAFDVKIMGN